MVNQIRVRSLKKYTPEFLIKELKKINFPEYNIFSNVNIAYLDLVEKILSVVDKIAPFKNLRIKNSTQDWRTIGELNAEVNVEMHETFP